MVVITVLLGTTTVSLSNTTINPALPQFMAAFDVGTATASWILTGFMISMGMTMPATGFLGQRFGNKALYLIGLALFIVASGAGALSTSVSEVIAARCVQGIAGGLMIPLSLTLIFAVYPKEQRGKVTGLWGMAVMLVPAVGPAVGGWVVQWFDWRALFLVNIPAGVLGWIAALCFLPGCPREDVRSFDWRGFALVTTGIGVLLVTLSRLTEPAALYSAESVSLLAVALGCLFLFVVVELRQPHPLLSLRIFVIGNYTVSVVLVVAQSIGMFGSIVLLPLLMQNVLGHGAALTGVALCVSALCAGAFTGLGGAALDAKGPRGIVTTGLILNSLATLALGFVDAHTSLGSIFAMMMIRGVGLGLSYIPVTTAGLNSVPEHLVTQGSAMNNILRRVAASIAVVLISSGFDLRNGQLLRAGLDEATAGATAINEMFLIMGGLILLVAPLALLLPHGARHLKPQLSE
jgi:EmrB/QacA subfamily drug resistance transporter